MEETKTWVPKTELGKKVSSKEITNIDEILNSGTVILEQEIVDQLLTYETELLLIGQAKGKFGGGQRRVFRQTQKKTKEGNKPHFTTLAVIGDKNGHLGIGYGKAKETVLAREKAMRKAKLNVFMISRGSGSWESKSHEPHTIPFAVEGKCGSVIIKLMPAPKGTGLVVEKECAKVLQLAGIKDIWSKTQGQTKNKINLINALEAALRNLVKTKVQDRFLAELVVVNGTYQSPAQQNQDEMTQSASADVDSAAEIKPQERRLSSAKGGREQKHPSNKDNKDRKGRDSKPRNASKDSKPKKGKESKK